MKKHLFSAIILFATVSATFAQSQIPTFYGMTSEGGTQLLGNIFQINSSGSAYQTDYSFYLQNSEPVANVIQANDGLLYGTLNGAGINNDGSIYSFNISTGTETGLHNFGTGSDGANPQSPLFQAKDNLLYGTTYNGGAHLGGTIYSYNISTSVETVVHDFSGTNDGYYPSGAVMQDTANGLLYGMTTHGGTNNGGILYSYNITTGTETVLHNFGGGTDGSGAEGALLQAANGLLYGLTRYGGTNGKGIIFSFDISTGIETDIYNFGTGSTDGQMPEGTLVQAANGLLYGNTSYGGVMSEGTFFSYNISSGVETDLHEFGTGNYDGEYPFGSPMLASDGIIYDMAADGGTSGLSGGIIFSYNTSTSSMVTIHNFQGVSGVSPYGQLIQATGSLFYGITYAGGTFNRGTIFNFNSSNYNYNAVFNFGAPTDGQYPDGKLILANDGLLYGSTSHGGITDSGTIFSFNSNTNVETDLYNFSGPDGSNPQGSLFQGSDGLLYGLTSTGGANDMGVIFSYDISSGIEKDVHDFSGSDGSYPFGSLVEASDGLLYGMTNTGGDNNGGVIFSFNISSGTTTAMYYLGSGTDAKNPFGSFIQANNGLLYGMTYAGGVNNLGAIISYNISTGTESVVHYFGDGLDGQNPYGSLIQAKDSKLYGMTYGGGGNGYGTLFNYDIPSATEIDLYDFGNGTNGANPFGSLIQASNGLLYGMTTYGSIYQEGTIFNYDLSTNTETDMQHFIVGETGGFPYGDLLEVDSVTMGINQLSVNNGQLTVYPNPSTGLVTISSTKNIDEITVTNLLGQIIYTRQPKQTKFNLKLKDAGMYFVTVKTGNTIATQKLIVAR